MGVQGVGDLAFEFADPGDHGLEGRDEGEHDPAACFGFQVAGAAGGGAPKPGEQLGGRASAAVAGASQKRCEPPLAEGLGVLRRGIAFEEAQRDRGVDVGEDARRAGPEAVKFGAQLVGQLHAGGDQVLAGAGERAQRLGGVAVGRERAEAVGVGARELAEHPGVEVIGLALGAKAGAGGLDLIGMQRQHAQAGVQQPLDQQSVRALDRDALDATADQQLTQGADALLVVGQDAFGEHLAVPVGHQDDVLVLGPVDSCADGHATSPAIGSSTRADRELPLRVLIDGRSHALRPVAASGGSHRRGEQVSQWPSTGLATEALPRRWSAYTEDDQ